MNFKIFIFGSFNSIMCLYMIFLRCWIGNFGSFGFWFSCAGSGKERWGFWWLFSFKGVGGF
uniref:Uncharacterized protein n=1 Tax=Rhizophora mucronata TaxID=61149 RepID=A0A2P2R0V7_RHIMU